MAICNGLYLICKIYDFSLFSFKGFLKILLINLTYGFCYKQIEHFLSTGLKMTDYS